MSRLLLQLFGTIRFLEHAQWVVKMARYCDVYFKQRAVTEFLVTEVESVTNIRKRLKNAHVVNAVDISNEGRWASRIADSEKGQAEFSDARRSGRPTTAVA
jgi:uncharacterized protein YlbG (UPF0298 family)